MKKNNRKSLGNRLAAGIVSFAVALVSTGCSTEVKRDVAIFYEMSDAEEIESLLKKLSDAYTKKLEILENKNRHTTSMRSVIRERDNLLDKKEVYLYFENSSLELFKDYVMSEIMNLTSLLEREKIDIGSIKINSVADAKVFVQSLREKNLTEDEVCVIEKIENRICIVENDLEEEKMDLSVIDTTLASDEMKIHNSDFITLELLESDLQKQEDLIVQIEEQLHELQIYELEEILVKVPLSTEQAEMIQSIITQISEVKSDIEIQYNYEDSKYDINDKIEKLLVHEREVIHFEEIMHSKHFDIANLIVIEASIDGIQEKDLYIIEKDSLITYDGIYKAMLYDYLKHEHDDKCIDYIHFYTHSMKSLSECLNVEERERYYKTLSYYELNPDAESIDWKVDGLSTLYFWSAPIDCHMVGISDLDTILERLRSDYKEKKQAYLASKTFDLSDLYVIETSNDLYIVDKISHFDVEYRDKFTAKEYSDLDSHEHDSNCLSYVHYDSKESKMLLEYLTMDEFKLITENGNKITGAELDEILQRIREEYCNSSKEKSWVKELINSNL